MIIGISGSQGQGKSTLIKYATDNDSNFIDIGLQTSRSLLADWGYTLDEVNSYLPLKIQFQRELYFKHANALDAKIAEHKISSSDNNERTLLVERTFADIFAYALISVGPYNSYSDWLDMYAKACHDAQIKYFDATIFLTGRTYIPAKDGVRSTNTHFASHVGTSIQHYMNEFSSNGTNYNISESNIEYRYSSLLGIRNTIRRV